MKHGRSTTLNLPNTVKPLDVLNLVKGYVPAVGVVKSETRAFPVNHPPAGWMNFGKPPLSLQIKIIKVDGRQNSVKFKAKVRGRSQAQFQPLSWNFSQKHVFPQVGRIWLEDVAGHKVSLGIGLIGSSKPDADGSVQATLEGNLMWSAQHSYTTLKIQVIEKTEPVRLKFELHNIKVPAYVPPKSGAGKP